MLVRNRMGEVVFVATKRECLCLEPTLAEAIGVRWCLNMAKEQQLNKFICTITPASSNMEETHNTLKFASRAKRVVIFASRNKIIDEKTLIKKYQREISILKLKKGMLVGVNHEEIMTIKQKRKRNTTRLINKTQLCWSVSFFFLLSVCTLIFSSTITCLDSSRCPMFVKAEIDFRKATLCIHHDKVQQKGTTLQEKCILVERVLDLL